jgi:flagellar hook-associated protein 2
VSSALSGADAGGAIAFGGNAVEATDARVLINNVTVTSDTNTVSDAILGVTLQLLKRDPDNVATITVGDNFDGSKAAIKNLVTAFNDLVKFTEDQNVAASKGDGSSIARDPLLRGLRGELREKLTAEYIAGGTYASLASVGFEFDRTGRISFKESVFDAAVQNNRADVTALFGADGTDKGVFQSLKDVVALYTNADGLLKDMNDRLDDQASAITRRIGDLEDRLAIRRQVLQQEFVAADMLMTQLNSQVNALSSLGSQYSLF